MCGSINVFAWISISAGVAILCPEYILAVAVNYHADYVPKAWHYFLVYQISNILCLLYNIFCIQRVSVVYHVACTTS